jgi:hypothetical protein
MALDHQILERRISLVLSVLFGPQRRYSPSLQAYAHHFSRFLRNAGNGPPDTGVTSQLPLEGRLKSGDLQNFGNAMLIIRFKIWEIRASLNHAHCGYCGRGGSALITHGTYKHYTSHLHSTAHFSAGTVFPVAVLTSSNTSLHEAVLLEKLIVEKFARFLGNPKLHHHIHKTQTLDPTLIHMEFNPHLVTFFKHLSPRMHVTCPAYLIPSPFFTSLGTKSGGEWPVSRPRYPCDRRLGGSQTRSGCYGKEKGKVAPVLD